MQKKSIAFIFALAMAASGSASADGIKDKNNMALIDEDLTAEFDYEKGSPFLDSSDRKTIDELVSRAKKRGEITEVKVLTWADREYPPEGSKADRKERDLASKRADKVRDYLKNTHKVGDVDTYNMAERPNALEKLFSSTEYEVKASAENAGTAPTEKRLNALRTNGRASSALLVVQLRSNR
jgi:hypothetical protein